MLTDTLRLFPHQDAAAEPGAPDVPVTLGTLLAAAGANAGRAWLGDFAGEPVLVSADLAEVLHAATAMRTDPAPLRRAA